MKLPQLNKLNFDREVLDRDGPVLVIFYSPRCAVCRSVIEAAKEFTESSQGVTVGTVNVDWNPQFSAAHNAARIPTLVLYRNGTELTRVAGPHSKEDILALIADRT